MGGKEASGKKKEGVADPGPTSLFLFTPSSPVRRLTTWFVNWPLFEWTIIITIIANCVVMALDDKLPYGDKTVLSIQMVSLSTFTQPFYNLQLLLLLLLLLGPFKSYNSN